MVEKILVVRIPESGLHDVSLVPTAGAGLVVFLSGGSLSERFCHHFISTLDTGVIRHVGIGLSLARSESSSDVFHYG